MEQFLHQGSKTLATHTQLQSLPALRILVDTRSDSFADLHSLDKQNMAKESLLHMESRSINTASCIQGWQDNNPEEWRPLATEPQEQSRFNRNNTKLSLLNTMRRKSIYCMSSQNRKPSTKERLYRPRQGLLPIPYGFQKNLQTAPVRRMKSVSSQNSFEIVEPKGIVRSLKAELSKLESPRKKFDRKDSFCQKYIGNFKDADGMFDPQETESVQKMFEMRVLEEIQKKRKQSTRVSEIIRCQNALLTDTSATNLCMPVSLPLGNLMNRTRTNILSGQSYRVTPTVPKSKNQAPAKKIQVLLKEEDALRRLNYQNATEGVRKAKFQRLASECKENEIMHLIKKKREELCELRPHKKNVVYYMDPKSKVHIHTLFRQ